MLEVVRIASELTTRCQNSRSELAQDLCQHRHLAEGHRSGTIDRQRLTQAVMRLGIRFDEEAMGFQLKTKIKRICELQPKYSSSNTPEMQERGNLIRSDLTQELRSRLRDLSRAFDPLFDDLAAEGSDGIGRKTEAPWVRLYSKAMSPTARAGFYVVVHFAADGSAVFVTIGCGSTV